MKRRMYHRMFRPAAAAPTLCACAVHFPDNLGLEIGPPAPRSPARGADL